MVQLPLLPQQQMQLQQAVALHQNGNVERARQMYRQVLLFQPDNADLLRMLGTAECQLGNLEEGARLLGQSLDIQPEQPGALHNRGNVLTSLGRFDEAAASYEKALAFKPDYAHAWAGRGDALTQSGRLEEALASYDRAVAIEPGFAEAYMERGDVLRQLGRFEEAIAAYRRALSIQPELAEAHIRLARLHERLGDIDLALAQWQRMATQFERARGEDAANLTGALNEMIRLYLTATLEDEKAEGMAQLSLSIDPDQRQTKQDYINARLRQCAWPAMAPFEGVSRYALRQAMSPFIACVHTDDPMLQLAVNWQTQVRDVPVAPQDIVVHTPPTDTGTAPLRIGYLSSDMREHAFGHLTYELPELHDRRRVEVFAYYCGPQADDALHAHFRAGYDRFIDISGMDDAAAAQRIQADGIQILVDCNGFTLHSRRGLLARRPAPVIASWLGFPGSAGSAGHNYIVADPWTIPPESELYYSEKVVRLPCYQPNNRRRQVAEAPLSRAAAGLPEQAFVYCSFNGTHKISPSMFDRWLTILQRVPGSVLWLLSDARTTQDHLRQYARDKGVDPARLVFAGYLPNAEHLTRYALADLFLDTAPYNAHTTCSDALWMGLPVLTCSGRSFASRVGGSLVRSAGLPELVCERFEDYVDQAVALAGDLDRLQGLRTRLREGRDTCVLFDTPLFVRSLEGLYADMWRAYVAGQLPKPDLRNLDIYLEEGLEHDPEAVEFRTDADYRAFWRQQLARRNADEPIPFDKRFWKGRF